jgi:hypothetical protein
MSLNGTAKGKRRYEKAKEEAMDIDPEVKTEAGRVKEADDAAESARLNAEAKFDEAERRLSSDIAREGAQKAIDSWELLEKAIRKAEAVGRGK